MLTNKDKEGYFHKPYLRAQNILWESVDLRSLKKMWFSQNELERLKISEGDLLVSEGGEIGRTAIWNNEIDECYIQNSVHKITFNKNHLSRYYLYLFEFYGKIGYFESIANRVSIAHLTKEKLKEIFCVSPSFEEQRQIVNYLDQKISEIDTFIANKERVVELLQEYRRALISEAVIKGLDLNVEMKYSGNEWFGEIPEHWEIWKISHGFSLIGSGTTPKSTENIYYDAGTIPWINSSDLRENIIYDTPNKITELALRNYPNLKYYPKGSLIIAMYGATIGRLGILGIPSTVNQACCVFSKPKYLDPIFTFYWLQMYRPVLIALGEGGGQPNMNQKKLVQIRIPAPDLEEQKRIANFLNQKTSEIDSFIFDVQNQIKKLSNYRESLISEAVTGKIDVRNHN